MGPMRGDGDDGVVIMILDYFATAPAHLAHRCPSWKKGEGRDSKCYRSCPVLLQ